VARTALELGWEVVGIRRGWGGLLNFNVDDEKSAEECLMPLTLQNIRTIDRAGGTILHTSRTNPEKVKPDDIPVFLKGKFAEPASGGTVDCTPHILEVIDELEIDALVAIGGDGTLSFAARLHRENVRIMSIPKTMDNDIYGTDCCIGFSTAISRSVDHINAIRTSAGSHERIAVIELFGRNSGETALISGYLADVDRTLIAELPFDIDRLCELLVEDRTDNPSNYAMVVISEGAKLVGGEVVQRGRADKYGNYKLGGIGEILRDELNRITGIDTISQNLGYMMRAGGPDALDRMVAKSYGMMAIQLLSEGQHGLMMALRDGKYTTVPADTCLRGQKRVDIDAFYDVETYRPRIARVCEKPMFLY
jgi:6-phosphofructokinase 1